MIADARLYAASVAAYVAPPTFLAGGDIHCDVTTDADSIIVAFRGTELNCIPDILRDLDALPIDDPDLGRCHAGFLSGARAVLPALLQALPMGKYLALTGHSLGGSLSIALAAILAAMGRPPQQLSTFGAANVGEDKLACWLAPIPGQRYRNGNDPVPPEPLWYKPDRPWTAIGRPEINPIDAHMLNRYGEALGFVAA